MQESLVNSSRTIQFKLKLIHYVRKKIKRFLCLVLPEFKEVFEKKNKVYKSFKNKTITGIKVKLFEPYKLMNVTVGDYTYIAQQSHLSHVVIGKFCSIGPNLRAGFGIHPISGLSTSPMFYSTKKQNGMTLSETDKIEERKIINIGNDVFIGMNVTILDGVTIGDGAVIGAGAVVSKDIPPYAIAVGCPIKIIGYRFEDQIINDLLAIKWWNLSDNNLSIIEKYFWKVEEGIRELKLVNNIIDDA